MILNNISNINFKGYDARELKGLIVTDSRYAEPLKSAMGDLKVDIYTPEIKDEKIKAEYDELQHENHVSWAQDYITVLKGISSIALLFDRSRDYLAPFLTAFTKQLHEEQKFQPFDLKTFFLRGGNFFICENGEKNKLLVGKNKDYIPENILKKMFNASEVHFIPQLDYHLDLFIRPLDNKNVLVSDINATRDTLKDGMQILKRYLKKHKVSEEKRAQLESIIHNIRKVNDSLSDSIKNDSYSPEKTMPQVLNSLRVAGMHPIRIPANYYYLVPMKNEQALEKAEEELKKYEETVRARAKLLPPNEAATILSLLEIAKKEKMQSPTYGADFVKTYYNNFINAIVLKKDNELHYITNAPILDDLIGITPEIAEETGFSFQKAFEESIRNFVKKENIHYIDKALTENLFALTGGVHCIAAEVVK